MEKSCATCGNENSVMCTTKFKGKFIGYALECASNKYCYYRPKINVTTKKEITELDKIRMSLYKDAYIECLKAMSPFPEGDIAGKFGRKAVERFDEFFNKEN